MPLRLTSKTAALLSLATVPNSLAAANPRAPIAQVPVAAPDIAILTRAERAVTAAEEWELKGAGAFGESPERAESLRDAGAHVSTYLKSDPNNVAALMLQARIARAMIVVTPVVIKLADDGTGRITDGDITEERDTALSALAKVIALQPQNAEAFYWKARTLNLSNRAAEEVGAEPASDKASAVEAARMAVQLAPSNPTYREYVAMVLFGIGRGGEGIEELRKLPFKHPVLQLADDEKTVPAPPNANVDEERAYDMAQTLFSGHMDVFRYAGKRPRVFKLALAPSGVEQFYRTLWPTIHWIKDRQNGSDAAALLWEQGGLTPIGDPAPFLNDFAKRVPPSGVLLVVARDEERKQPASTLYVVNFRRFEQPK